MLAPHVTLDRTLREVADDSTTPLTAVAAILRTARIAELSSFGRIAEERVRVIERLESLKDDTTSQEREFQKLVYEAPWLIDPQWSPLTANQPFSTLKEEFQKYYKKITKQKILLNDFSDTTKRPDFVLASHGPTIEIVEIKRPNHALQNLEMERIQTYVEVMEKFLNEPGHEDFRRRFPEFHVTLVCDNVNLTGVHKGSFEGLRKPEKLTWITWSSFLLRTRTAHQEFLNQAERLRKIGNGK
jgi:hypothetical protein